MIDNFTKFSAIVHYKQFGGTVRHVARQYGVSKSSVARWVNANPDCVKIRCLRRDRKSALKTLLL
jgi:transposase